MSFTRFNDDPCRIKKQLQQSTDQCRWIMNVPGNGPTPDFIEDPHIRLQKWGGNLQTNCVNLESSLLGINNYNPKDCLGKNKSKIISNKINCPVNNTCITDESRSSNPAWTLRTKENNINNYYTTDSNKFEIPFYNNISTRILEKNK